MPIPKSRPDIMGEALDMGTDQAGVVYNPEPPTLWLVRNNGPSRVWSLVRDANDVWQIDPSGTPAIWSNFGDAEGVTLADWDEEFRVLVLNEGGGRIGEWDFSDYSSKTQLNMWDIAELGGAGAEGLTFVPDSALAASGFVDGNLYKHRRDGRTRFRRPPIRWATRGR